MARLFDVHPDNPQARSINQVVDVLRSGGLIVYPTDSGFALGCTLGNSEGLDRIRTIRQLDRHHHFTLVCSSMAQLGHYVEMSNDVFRAIKANTPGPYTFILRATREAPKAMLHPKKRTVGVRVPKHVTALALLDALDEPLMSSTLLLPGSEDAPTDGWTIAEDLAHQVDAVVDSGDVGQGPTTVIDFSEGEATVVRLGAGDPEPFGAE